MKKESKEVKKITISQAKRWFYFLDIIDNLHSELIDFLEQEIRRECKNNNLMFVWVDGEVVGIGSEDRKMKMIHRW